MRVGINIGLVPDGATPVPYDEVLNLAEQVEGLGFDSIWFADHLLYREPGNQDTGPLESWTLLTAVAARVPRITVGPIVAATPFRNPAVLAKSAVTLDEISGGRLVLGLGAGILEPEFRAFGIPFDHRFDRFEEAVQIIVSLLRTGRADVRGRYHRAEECVLVPATPQGGIPVMIGGKGPRMLDLAARFADWWNGYWIGSPAGLEDYRNRLERACSEARRDQLPVISVLAHALLEDAPADGGTETTVRGTPTELAAALAEYAAAGVDHLILRALPQTPRSMATLAEALALSRA